MKLKRALFFLALLPMIALAFTSCNKCENEGSIDLGADFQHFSVTYQANDSVSTNLITGGLANPSNITILLNTDGGKGQYSAVQEDLTDGVVGPFNFTASPKSAQLGVPYDYWYIVQMDTFAVDTFRLFFVPTVDECSEYWAALEYYQNGDLIASDVEMVDHIRVVE